MISKNQRLNASATPMEICDSPKSYQIYLEKLPEYQMGVSGFVNAAGGLRYIFSTGSEIQQVA